MNNHPSEHWTSDERMLEAFVLHKMNNKEMSFLSTHLETCEVCRKRVGEEREIYTGIQRFGRLEIKRRLKLRLRSDQNRSFEWIHVASLAAAIVIMLGGVYAIRWFLETKRERTKVHEIIFTEQKENEPGNHPLWIIGRVVELKNSKRSLKRIRHSIMDALSKDAPTLSLKKSEGHKDFIEKEDIRSRMAGQNNSMLSEAAKNQSTRPLGIDSSASVANQKLMTQGGAMTRQKYAHFPAKNIIVRKGKMKDLPSSLAASDASAIHTRLDRTPGGILLTFYSNVIIDTVATNIEVSTQDSIIVTFHSKQVVYYVPGGLAGGI